MLALHDLTWEPNEDWRRQAACAEAPTELFFPTEEDPAGSRVAKEICAACPVREACLQFALSTNQTEGVWGGMDADDRRRLRRRIRDRRRRLAS